MASSELKLRALEPDDIDLLYLWENSPEMWRYGYSQAPLSRQQIWTYIREYDSNPLTAGQLRLMIDAVGTTVGAVDLYDVDVLNRRAMVGIMIAGTHRRKGYASRALAIVGEYCRDNLGLFQLGAMVGADNEPSLELFKKSGFLETALLRSWFRCGTCYCDAVVFQRFLTGITNA